MNQRVLVIDDEMTFRMFLEELFESRGCCVTGASNGLDGLKLAMTEKYDVIITDMVMPGTTGTELIVQLRKSGIDTPIIAITGHSARDAHLFRAKKYNADCVVHKPFTAKELIDAVDVAIKSRMNQEYGAHEPTNTDY